MTVAALYVEKGGVYCGLDDVDPWDEERDARLYAGPWPVVAHPPCNKWSPLAYINQRRLPDYRLGDDGGCFEAALDAVLSFGGVLEHPATTLAYRFFNIPRPERGGFQSAVVWRYGRAHRVWLTEVDQGRYGHRARKRTWLLYAGSLDLSFPDLDWREAMSSTIVSGFLHRTGTDETRRVRPREAASTPPAFRDVLLAMARSAAKPELVAAGEGQAR